MLRCSELTMSCICSSVGRLTVDMGPPNGVAAAGIAGAAIRDRPLRAELVRRWMDERRFAAAAAPPLAGARAEPFVEDDDRQLWTRPRGGAAAGTAYVLRAPPRPTSSAIAPPLHRADVEFAGDAAALDQHDAACDIEHEFKILLDDQHRQAMFLAQACQELADLLNDRRLNSLRRLVKKQKPRQRHERARQRQYLLLAAGQRATPALQQAASAAGKIREHALDRTLLGLTGIRRPCQAKIFVRAQARKDAAALRHIGDAEAAALMRRPAGHVHPVDHDLAAARPATTP